MYHIIIAVDPLSFQGVLQVSKRETHVHQVAKERVRNISTQTVQQFSYSSSSLEYNYNQTIHRCSHSPVCSCLMEN